MALVAAVGMPILSTRPLATAGLATTVGRSAWRQAVLAAAVAAATVAAMGGGAPVIGAGAAWSIRQVVRGALPVGGFLAGAGMLQLALGAVTRWGIGRAGGTAEPPTVAVALEAADVAFAACVGLATLALGCLCRRMGASPADAATAALLPSGAAVVAAAAQPGHGITALAWGGMATALVVGLAGTVSSPRSARVAATSPWRAALPPQQGFRVGLSQAAMVGSLLSLAAWLVQEPVRADLHALAAGLALVSLAVPLVALGVGSRRAATWRRLVDVRGDRRPRWAAARLAARVFLGHAAIAVWPLVVACLLTPTGEARAAVVWPAGGCLLLAAALSLGWSLLDSHLPDGETAQAMMLVVLAVGGLLAGLD